MTSKKFIGIAAATAGTSFIIGLIINATYKKTNDNKDFVKEIYDFIQYKRTNIVPILKILRNPNYNIPVHAIENLLRYNFNIYLIPDRYINEQICCNFIKSKKYPIWNYSKIPTKFYTFKVCKLALQHGMKFNELSEKNKTAELYDFAIKNNFINFADTPDEYKTESQYMQELTMQRITYEKIPEDKRTINIHYLALTSNLIENMDLVSADKFTPFVLDKMVKMGMFIKIPQLYLTQDICNQAVKYGYSINDIPKKYQTDELYKVAIQANYMNIQYIENPSDELCYLAINRSIHAITHIKPEKISFDMCTTQMQKYLSLYNIPDKCITKEMIQMYFEKYHVEIMSHYYMNFTNLSEQHIDDIIDLKDNNPLIDIEIFKMCVLSGVQFNKLSRNRKFIKLTSKSEIHNGLQFNDGLIQDILPFDPSNQCSPGGIYFCDLLNIKKWLQYGNNTMHYVRSVVIPDDAKIYIETGKFKANKIILGPRELISDIVSYYE
jgi:hypothetical protein